MLKLKKDAIMQIVTQQAYQAEVLLRKVQIVTVGSRYPFKDQIVLTTENILRHADNPLFTYAHRIDVVINCENKLEAMKVNKEIKEYFAKDMMLPLHVGVFQKPWTNPKLKEKTRKYYAHATINAKDISTHLKELEKNKAMKYSIGASPVESNMLVNGFDLTYMVANFQMEHNFLTEIEGKELEKPIYRLTLSTVSIIENYEEGKEDEATQEDESVLFQINGDSESEINALAEKFAKLQFDKKEIFTCKGGFPKKEKDHYVVRLGKSASELLMMMSKPDIKNEVKV